MLCYGMLRSYVLTTAKCVGGYGAPSFKYHAQICLVVVVVVVLRVNTVNPYGKPPNIPYHTVRCIAGSHLCSHLPLSTDI